MVSVKMGTVPTTVVLLHGFAGTGRAWDPVVERLDPERYTPLAPDLRGHGSARDARPVSFAACVADVLAPAAAARIWREDLERNDPRALAAALRGMGTGAMEPLWDRLGALPMPATVLVGAEDPKFVALGERLAAALPAAELVVVEGAGHGLPREAPDAVVAALAGR